MLFSWRVAQARETALPWPVPAPKLDRSHVLDRSCSPHKENGGVSRSSRDSSEYSNRPTGACSGWVAGPTRTGPSGSRPARGPNPPTLTSGGRSQGFAAVVTQAIGSLPPGAPVPESWLPAPVPSHAERVRALGIKLAQSGRSSTRLAHVLAATPPPHPGRLPTWSAPESLPHTSGRDGLTPLLPPQGAGPLPSQPNSEEITVDLTQAGSPVSPHRPASPLVLDLCDQPSPEASARCRATRRQASAPTVSLHRVKRPSPSQRPIDHAPAATVPDRPRHAFHALPTAIGPTALGCAAPKAAHGRRSRPPGYRQIPWSRLRPHLRAVGLWTSSRPGFRRTAAVRELLRIWYAQHLLPRPAELDETSPPASPITAKDRFSGPKSASPSVSASVAASESRPASRSRPSSRDGSPGTPPPRTVREHALHILQLNPPLFPDADARSSVSELRFAGVVGVYDALLLHLPIPLPLFLGVIRAHNCPLTRGQVMALAHDLGLALEPERTASTSPHP